MIDPIAEGLVTGWQAYLSATPSSPLVLTCLNTIVGSLNVSLGATVWYGIY